MSMPITFTAPVAPASPAPAGATATSGEPGALFGAVLSGISAGLGGSGGSSDGSADGDSDVPTEESLDALAAAASAPLGGALLVGLNLPISDGRTVSGATGPTGGTGVPPALSGNLVPAPTGASAPGQPGAFTLGQPGALALAGQQAVPGTQGAQPTQATQPRAAGAASVGAPSTMDTPVVPGANAPGAVPPSGPAAVTAAGAPVLPAAQAVAGAAAAAVLTGTLTGTLAGSAAGTTAPGTPRVAATDPVARVGTGAPGTESSTVDTGTGSPVETAVRSRHAFGDTTSGQDGGDGRLTRGPEASWAPTLAAARADSAAPTMPAAPAQSSAPQLPPAAQLALRLAPLRAGPDGTHQLTILLNPEELGPVSVVATVKGDQLSVQLTGATEVGRDALRAALPQLERDLRDGGFATLNLNVRDTPPPDPRPAWAAQAAPQPTQAAPAVAPVTPTATDYATDGTAATTSGAKTDGQPIGQILRPDGSGPIRRDDSIGQYNAAGAVAATHQSSGAQSSGPQSGGGGPGQQQSTQLNLGQPGGQPGQQPNQPGFAEQHANGGRHSGTAHDNGTGAQAGHNEPGEPDPPATGNRPANRTGIRSVDLRV